MKDDHPSPEPGLNQRIADRVKELRAKQRISLNALASKSGVSRSMISLVERGESSPTAVVLGKLAAGLDVPMASLFDAPAGDEQPPSPVVRRKDQAEWQDPASGYVRRNISPPGMAQPMQIVEVEFPPGQRVTFEGSVPALRVYHQIWVLEGTIEITIGEECHRLRQGDCLAWDHAVTVFHNPTRKATRYAVVVATEPLKKR